MNPEPQTNGKTINWCTVDVGSANGTGEPQGIVCGAHNFAPGDLVVVILPGGVLPGPFEISARKTYGHVSAGMICSARELGLGEDHDGIIVLAPDAGEPGEDALRSAADPGRGHRVRDQPRSRLCPVAARGGSGGGSGVRSPQTCAATFTDPALRSTPAANSDGYPVIVEDTVGCPVFVARQVNGFDPTAQSPGWLTRRLTHGRDEADLTGCRCHELRDVGVGSPDSWLRRRQVVRTPSCTPRCRRGASDDPGRR